MSSNSPLPYVVSLIAHILVVAVVIGSGYLLDWLLEKEPIKTPAYVKATLYSEKTTTVQAADNQRAKQTEESLPEPVQAEEEIIKTVDPVDTEALKAAQEQLKQQAQALEQQQQAAQAKKEAQEKAAKEAAEQKEAAAKAIEQAKLKAKQEADKKAEEAAKAKAEAEKKAKAEAEAKKVAEAKKAKEQAAKKKAKEAAEKKAKAAAKAKEDMKKRLEAERKESLSNRLQAEQAARQSQSYTAGISQEISSQFRKVATAKPGITVDLEIVFMPSGEVRSVRVIRSSGDTLFDDAAVRAVKRASPIQTVSQIPSALFQSEFKRYQTRFNPW